MDACMMSTCLGGCVALYSSPMSLASICTSTSVKYIPRSTGFLYLLATQFCAFFQSWYTLVVKVESFFMAKHSRMAPAAKGLDSTLTSTSSVTHCRVRELYRYRITCSMGSRCRLRPAHGSVTLVATSMAFFHLSDPLRPPRDPTLKGRLSSKSTRGDGDGETSSESGVCSSCTGNLGFGTWIGAGTAFAFGTSAFGLDAAGGTADRRRPKACTAEA
mmetsp:Transcript_13041/g.31915  ORF Transcript_13041/g.31915 Transcript_13041/m.31915 type:complete len:217 (-) Transcript_13041:205-855(-)